jgi:YgiT-type zinc finger domain-containing protein
MECPVCEKGKLTRKKVDYSYKDWYFGKYDADVCNKCGESFFTEEASDLIEKKARKLALWGIEKKTKISHSGNSLIVRIPKAIAKFVEIEEGEEVTIRPEGKKKFIVDATN